MGRALEDEKVDTDLVIRICGDVKVTVFRISEGQFSAAKCNVREIPAADPILGGPDSINSKVNSASHASVHTIAGKDSRHRPLSQLHKE
jgi:hypothetical protein